MQKIIVDGYNLLFHLNLSCESLHMEREGLLNLLSDYASLAKVKLTVVFDAYKTEEPPKRSSFHYIEVVYSAWKQTADQYILEYLEHLPDCKGIILVTNDGELTRLCRHLGVQTLGCIEWMEQMKKKGKEKKPVSTEAFLPSLDGEPYPYYRYYLKLFEERAKE